MRRLVAQGGVRIDGEPLTEHDVPRERLAGRALQAGQRRLNHYLSVPVAHKTGDFPPVLANDVGIIYARSGPIVVSFLGNAITGNYGEAEDHIGRFAQQLVEYFDK